MHVFHSPVLNPSSTNIRDRPPISCTCTVHTRPCSDIGSTQTCRQVGLNVRALRTSTRCKFSDSTIRHLTTENVRLAPAVGWCTFGSPWGPAQGRFADLGARSTMDEGNDTSRPRFVFLWVRSLLKTTGFRTALRCFVWSCVRRRSVGVSIGMGV